MALVGGIAAVALIIEGGFFAPWVEVLPALLAAAALVSATLGSPPLDRSCRAVVGASVAFASWWIVSGIMAGDVGGSTRLACSVIAFAAAFSIAARLERAERHTLHAAIIAAGCAYAAIGLIALAWRAYPLAMQAQGLWRLAGTLTYADAAGLFLAVVLILAVCFDGMPPRVQRCAVFLLAVGLAATMSRGGLLALGAGAAFVGRARLRALVWPGALAIGCALVILATAHSPHVQPLILAAVALGAGASVLPGKPTLRAAVGLAGLSALIGVLVLGTDAGHLTTTVERRASTAGVADREAEWRAA